MRGVDLSEFRDGASPTGTARTPGRRGEPMTSPADTGGVGTPLACARASAPRAHPRVVCANPGSPAAFTAELLGEAKVDALDPDVVRLMGHLETLSSSIRVCSQSHTHKHVG